MKHFIENNKIWFENDLWNCICPSCNKVISNISKKYCLDRIKSGRNCKECGYKNRIVWNTGLTKETSQRLKEVGENISKTKIQKFKSGELQVWSKGLTKETNQSLLNNSLKQKNKYVSDETREKISISSKERWLVPSYREKLLPHMKKMSLLAKQKHINTKPELIVEQLLIEMNINYIKQYKLTKTYPYTKPVHRYYDFYLPEYDKLIEVHGVYWHGRNKTYDELNDIQKRSRNNDFLKKWIAIDHNLHYFSIWEDEVYNSIFLKTKIKYIIEKQMVFESSSTSSNLPKLKKVLMPDWNDFLIKNEFT